MRPSSANRSPKERDDRHEADKRDADPFQRLDEGWLPFRVFFSLTEMRSECRSLSAYRTIVNQWLKLLSLCH